jgi:hypothetical protein
MEFLHMSKEFISFNDQVLSHRLSMGKSSHAGVGKKIGQEEWGPTEWRYDLAWTQQHWFLKWFNTIPSECNLESIPIHQT